MAVPNSVFRSSTAPNAANSCADLLTFKGGNRKSSSETRTSSSPEDVNIANLTSRRRRDNRPSSRGKRRSHPNGLLPIDKSTDSEFPSVLDENITGTRLQLPVQNAKSRSTGRLAVLKPLNSNEQLSGFVQSSPTHRNPNPLSISGLAKPENSSDEPVDTTWTSSKTPTASRQPAAVNHTTNNNNSNSAKSATSSSSQSTGTLKPDSIGTLAGLTVNATGTTTYNVARKPNKQSVSNQVSSFSNSKQSLKRTGPTSEAEAKYADPIAGASASFQARLSELASLEAETVRYERLRRLKKKNKDRDD
ncbi:uncharacterized protein [Watersipora subatra]|uniref:uncharacterized protein isoform X2 n=1 Tax=Watersipora subatra TaxID=2589382 RepID=UPI00355BFA2E